MKKPLTLLLLFLSVVTVKAQVFIELVNTTGSYIENLTVNGKSYGALALCKSKIIDLPEVALEVGELKLSLLIAINGTVLSNAEDVRSINVYQYIKWGSFKEAIVLEPVHWGLERVALRSYVRSIACPDTE